MKKICVITGSRAEYGLLYWLMQAIQNEAKFMLQVVVTGSHLSPEFGMTATEVEKSFSIDKKIEIVLSADTPTAISKSAGLAMISLSEAYQELKPDLIVILGDRYEMLAAATCANIARIPVAHIHGGELTQGAIDDGFRHAISKMSHLHFTSTEPYRQRVIQLGEPPERVYCFGAMGVENIHRLSLLSKERLERELKFKFLNKNLLITFHPETLGKNTSRQSFTHLLNALKTIPDVGLLFTKANADTDGRIINDLIDEFVSHEMHRAIAFPSMGQLNYLSTLQFVDAVIGNSSSALIEVPSFHIPSINIGERQSGRIKAESVIDCACDSQDLIDVIHLALSPACKAKARQATNPYDQGVCSQHIVNVIGHTDFSSLIQKTFYDIKNTEL